MSAYRKESEIDRWRSVPGSSLGNNLQRFISSDFHLISVDYKRYTITDKIQINQR
jgi:hypothetical protein